MAKKITELTEATTVNSNDLFVVVQDGETKNLKMETLNNNINWKLLGNITNVGSSYALNIPSNAKEIFIETFPTSNNDGVTQHILTFTLKTSNKGYDAGYYKNSSDMIRVLTYANTSKIWLQEIIFSGESKSTVSSCAVYYK